MSKTKDFYYDLPQELIAQTPAEPRDSSRLLVFHRQDNFIEHQHFFDLPRYLRPGDALVVNNTKVIPARLLGIREESGGNAELLLLRRHSKDQWEGLVRPGKKMREGSFLSFGDGLLRAEILARTESGGRMVQFHYEGTFEALLDQLGQMPLPPYITQRLEDPSRYQTVYAKDEGSAAAPTAGLHFTPQLLDQIRQMGVHIVPVLLHVGLGTFRPVKAENIHEHVMHEEFFQIEKESADILNAVRQAGGRIICVGTTCVRTLESAADEAGTIHATSGETAIFISPGYTFRAVDALITNFHLPESTLLMLISAMMGRENALHAYETAVRERYRFFSFGDAMFIE